MWFYGTNCLFRLYHGSSNDDIAYFTLCSVELKVKMIHGFSFARCDSKGLLDSLCTRILATRDGNITMSLDVVAATVNRDTLAKTIYSRLFDWYALVAELVY